MHLIKHQPEHFRIISGDDNITLPMMSLGAIGVISVVAQAFPKEFSSMVDHALQGNYTKSLQHHYRLLDSMELFFVEGSPPGIKAALHALGLCENVFRLPIVPVGDSLYSKIAKQVNDLVGTAVA
jgi:4-hydroxy-tetrahydrodipicolinate synthase